MRFSKSYCPIIIRHFSHCVVIALKAISYACDETVTFEFICGAGVLREEFADYRVIRGKMSCPKSTAAWNSVSGSACWRNLCAGLEAYFPHSSEASDPPERG